MYTEGKRPKGQLEEVSSGPLNTTIDLEPSLSPRNQISSLSARGDRLFVNLHVGDKILPTLIDTGANQSFISSEGLSLLSSSAYTLKAITPFKVSVANGAQEVVQNAVVLVASLHGRQLELHLILLPNLTVPCLLGVNFMRSLGMVIDASDSQWWLKDQPLNPLPFCGEPRPRTEIAGIRRLEPKEAEELERLLQVELARGDGSMGLTTLTEHVIDVGNQRPIKQRAYPVSPVIQDAINQEVDRMLQEDILEPSHSPWSSPIVMVKKPDGKYRFCIDYRKVNAVTKPDVYPLPNMSSLLDQLRACRYLSKIDLAHAYHQIPLAESSREITAFIALGRGLFQFKRLPYGLCGAPATFQRLLDTIITPDLAPSCFAYLDDIVIATATFKDHLQYLRLVLGKLRQAGLRLNLQKSEFGCSEIQYLGFLVNENGLQVDPSKVEPLLQYIAPKNIQGLRRLIGMASWYRRFIPNFADRIRPLTSLLKKGRTFLWGEEQERALQDIKSTLTTEPVLARPDFSKEFVLQTDASSTGVGAVLTQYFDGVDRVIAYASRSLSRSEENYSVTEKECLAVLWAVRKFRPYIEGYRFTVITDHASLKWLNNLKNPTGRLARWALEIQGYQFDIKYRKGTAHSVPDFLSRLPTPEEHREIGLLQEEAIPITDPWYITKKEKVSQRPQHFPDWKIEEGYLYHHRSPDISCFPEDNSLEWKLVVPKDHIPRILQENHDRPEAGHLGFDKTYHRTSRRYYWPGMYNEIANYVKRCNVCQKIKPIQRLPEGKMSVRSYTVPWDTVSADIMGPLPRSSNGYSYLLIFLDSFTKWTEVIPLRTASAQNVCKAFRQTVVYRWGTPRVLHTDNGTPFVNKLMEGLAERLGVKLSRTPPYWPQANPVERTNRVVKGIISSYLSDQHRKWDQYLPEVMFAINSSLHSSTGFSPAYLNFGREPRAPKTYYAERNNGENASPPDTCVWSRHLLKLKELREVAESKLSKASAKQTYYYNLRRRDAKYKVGDLVLRRAHPQSAGAVGFASKLAPKYEGPYRIVGQRASNTYTLETPNGRPAGLSHAGQLKIFQDA